MERTLEQVLLDVLDSRARDLHTCMPGRVESYDAAKQTAAVQPMLKRVDVDDRGGQFVESYPTLANVPVLWPRFGGFFIHGPLTRGDFVLLAFSEAPTDPFRARGTETHPGDLRRHTMTGAVAIPGFYPTAAALSSANGDLVIGHTSGGEIRLATDGQIKVGEGATNYVALANLVLSELNAIRTAFDAHTHVVATTGTATAQSGTASPTTSPLGPAGSVAATKVKAK